MFKMINKLAHSVIISCDAYESWLDIKVDILEDGAIASAKHARSVAKLTSLEDKLALVKAKRELSLAKDKAPSEVVEHDDIVYPTFEEDVYTEADFQVY